MKRLWFVCVLAACRTEVPIDAPIATAPNTFVDAAVVAPSRCLAPSPMTVHFYDVGQGLAALVELPGVHHETRRILVDTGDDPARSEDQCHGACVRWHESLMSALARDVGDAPIDVVWITHQHSDHLGGAVDVLTRFQVKTLVDNGEEPHKAEVNRLHELAVFRGVQRSTVDPTHRELSSMIADLSADVRLTAIVPSVWPHDCSRDPNDCSIGLRIDDCASSVLFLGDAEKPEEATLDVLGPVTLLQVGHHGSDTSTTPELLAKTQPRYAVISSAKRDEGTNVSYCHPRRGVVDRLTTALGGPGKNKAMVWAGARHEVCRPHDSRTEEHWESVPTNDHLWLTARDGDVVLTTNGDGNFARQKAN